MSSARSVLSLSKVLWSQPWAGLKGNTVIRPVICSRREKSSYTPPPAKYGGRHTVTLIPGDGIGPELLSHARELFRFCCVPVDFEVVSVDSTATSEDDINNAVTAIRRNGVALKGNIETNHRLPPSHKSRNNLLRTSLDLYANVMHCQTLPGVQTRHKDIDIIIIRENTEGEYSSLEHENVPGVVECLKIITQMNSLRIAEYAFKLAREKGRRRVTAVHKANIMKLGDGLFLQCCKEVAAGYPDITFDNMIVDNTTMQLVSKPQQFDVMVMPNLYGNVVSNVCAGLVGGPGLVPGANYGKDYAVFETVRKGITLYTSTIGKRAIRKIPDILIIFVLCAAGHKEHWEKHCKQEHCKPHSYTVGQLPHAGSLKVCEAKSDLASSADLKMQFVMIQNYFSNYNNNNSKCCQAKQTSPGRTYDEDKGRYCEKNRLHEYASIIRKAVLTTLSETQLHTADLGGQGTTSEVVQAIMQEVQRSKLHISKPM
ncbi:isocitrate dehydrogenase [NAD] subunit gamma, mitochondrial-like isoform X2 [Neoarius graeffei]|uniref:isocitrate dehydrogenase [NAD] subunit gamma, mitochondrial-like isoform X2 n=1 Tax=Neoarius graeffei TaxID=443677 RepID=UPI00298D0475|nr:isocitrate dehydrogenase [NAD] subunit gamma, mitochondrial-like isoform X2 [Neoarius graeffei]